MADEYDETFVEGDEPVDPNDPSAVVKQLRAHNKRLEKEVKELAVAKREMAFLKAGIDLSDKKAAFFAKHYEGDLADVETLRAEAVEFGVLADSQTEASTGTADGTTEAHAEGSVEVTGSIERRALADGAPADTGEEIPTKTQLLDRAKENAKTYSFETAAGDYVHQLAARAMEGDTSVLVEPRTR